MLNKAMLIGNLGAAPEIRNLNGGTTMAKFSIATSRKDSNGNEHTEWHNIVAWNKLAENCQKYLNKGDKVYVEGEIRTRKYEKGGDTRYFTEINAQTIRFLSTKGSHGNQGDGSRQSDKDQNDLGYGTEEIPEFGADDDVPF